MASWTSWTNLIDIPLGTTLYTTSWNAIFSPNGNEAHLKKYADAITYEQEIIYYLEERTILSGWPQGGITTPQGFPEYYVTGDVTYPKWTIAGILLDNYITLSGPAKYLSVINIDYYPTSINATFQPLLRIIISDTSGNLHLQKTVLSPRVVTPDNSLESLSFPFIIDTNTETNLVVGFVLQGGSVGGGGPSIQLQNSSSIRFHKLPALIPNLNATTSFVLGTTTLSGTSGF
jgi:hypothetical protein